MTRTRAAWLLVAMFLLGACGGAAGIGAYVSYQFQHGRFPDRPSDRIITDRLAHRLDLDATQKKVLRQVVARTRVRLREARESLRPRFEAIIDQGHQELLPVLRPEQVEELNHIRAEREAIPPTRRSPT